MPGKMTRTWLLIADGRRAKVVQADGVRGSFRSVDDMARSIELPKNREIQADKPGRTFDSIGAGRHAKESPTDPQRNLKREFAKRLMDELRQAMLAKRFDRVIMVAPPAFLGDLRAALPKNLRDKVAAEVAADLTNTPQQELHGHLQDILERAA